MHKDGAQALAEVRRELDSLVTGNRAAEFQTLRMEPCSLDTQQAAVRFSPLSGETCHCCVN